MPAPERTIGPDELRRILDDPAAHPWKVQGIGLLSLRLDDRREHRLHVWDPERAPARPPIHDHPYDFTSTVIVGELTDTTWVEDPTGEEHVRERYRPGAEDERTCDEVRLVGAPSVLRAGQTYHHRAADLHDSRQVPGTVTVMRCTWVEERELTVCRRPDDPWVSTASRPATPDEVERITAPALELLRPLRP